MIYGNTNFPTLATKRIVVSTNNPSAQSVKVEFLIRSQERSSLSTWLQDAFSEYSNYLRINFFLLDNTTESLAITLQNSSLRYRSLSDIVFEQIRRNQRFNYDNSSISFREVLEDGFSTSIPVTDLSLDYYHDIYSEIEIPINNIDLTEASRLHLICFIHMDVDSYFSDKGLSRDPNEIDPLESVGGELVYDLLLERTSDELRTPQFREIFYIETIDSSMGNATTLRPYYGPAHYHDESSPGPGGYVGWMAGFPGQDMGPQLQTRTIRNNKIFSDIPSSFEQAISIDSNLGFGFPDSSNSVDIERYTNSVISEDEITNSILRIQKKSEIVKHRESQRKVSVLLNSDIQSNFVASIGQTIEGEDNTTNIESYHGVVMGIEYYRLVRDFSKYGNILQFHESEGNRNLVERLLAETTILNLEVTRERVTNHPHHFNEEDTLIHETFDINQPETRLVMTNDPPPRTFSVGENFWKNKLFPANSQLASVDEINLVGPQDPRSGLHTEIPGYNRFFFIKDYDMYHNVQFGKYRHILDFTIEDGVYRYIALVCQQLKAAIRLFAQYRNQASIPVIKTDQGSYVSGNYDYATNSFHPSFRELDYASIITYSLNSYRDAVLFLTGKLITDEKITDLVNFLSPASTDLEILNKFSETLNMLLQSSISIMNQNGDSFLFREIKTSRELNVSNSGYGTKARVIRVKVKNSEIIESIQEGAVVADYSLYWDESTSTSANTPNLSLQNYLSRASELVERYNFGKIMPAAYLRFTPSPYDVDQIANSVGMQAQQRQYVPGFIKPISLATPMVISTHKSYMGAPSFNKFEQQSQVNIMRNMDSVKSNFINKGSLSITEQLFKNAGVFFNFSSPLQRDKLNATEARQRNNCLELSAGIKEALKAAAKRGEQPKEVFDSIEKNYGNLNNIRDILGPVYDKNLSLFGSLSSINEKISTIERVFQSQQDKYTGNIPQVDTDLSTTNNQIYQKEIAEVKVVVPGGESINLNTQIQTTQQTVESARGFVLVKVETSKKQDSVISVNNGNLLRV